MKINKRVFVAAWEYPPILSGESIVCRKTLEYSKFDYDLCCGPVERMNGTHVRLFPMEGNKYLQWPLQAARQFKILDKREHYTVMMSRVMPPNGHWAGWIIKRMRPSIKWIVYFSDPIWNSPFLRLSLRRNDDHRPNWLLMKIFGIPAKWAVHEGDLLVFNNERLAQFVLGKQYERYKKKVLIAPYGHEGVHLRPASQRGDGKFRLTHVGQLYGNRTLKGLVEGITLLKQQRPDLYGRLSIRQVGFASESERRRVCESEVADAFTFVSEVPYAQSVEEMYRSDCLLVIDPVFDRAEKNIYIPGKLFDYLSTGHPIFCIADENSATGDMARMLGCLLADGRQAGAVASALEQILQKGILGPPPDVLEQFNCRYGVDALDNAISQLLL